MRVRALIALALVGALAGCQESGFDESKETQRPLKVQDAMNPLTGTKVPGQAERPATLTADALGDTLALRVRPVAAAEVPPYMRSAARGVDVVRDDDLAAIAAATPDVILGSKDGQGSLYTDLSKIAPTILSDGDDWKLTLRLHGEALGRTNDAERLLIDWDNRLARVRRKLGRGEVSVQLAGGAEARAGRPDGPRRPRDQRRERREAGSAHRSGPGMDRRRAPAARATLEDVARSL